MPHNTKLVFRSFKKGCKEKLIQMEQFLKIISSKVTQISVFLFLLYRSSYEAIVFHI